ncbi:hypothetical protein EO95_03325 [Methanosarcina sp. 1.H.T.1A.1]|nr:hypothetical protein EO93_14935 [Methanosarcina sp. 1.H.A.2.2]KKH98244.1 hypothetical protein EO95_03325 [Methanosarcina sp. 1.H.T.1A.1]
MIELIQKSIFILIIIIIQDCFHDRKLDWSLKILDPKKQIFNFGIGSLKSLGLTQLNQKPVA